MCPGLWVSCGAAPGPALEVTWLELECLFPPQPGTAYSLLIRFLLLLLLLFSSKRPVFSTCSAPPTHTKEVEKQCKDICFGASKPFVLHFGLKSGEIIAKASVQAIKLPPLEKLKISSCCLIFSISLFLKESGLIGNNAALSRDPSKQVCFDVFTGKTLKNTFDISLLIPPHSGPSGLPRDN